MNIYIIKNHYLNAKGKVRKDVGNHVYHSLKEALAGLGHKLSVVNPNLEPDYEPSSDLIINWGVSSDNLVNFPKLNSIVNKVGVHNFINNPFGITDSVDKAQTLSLLKNMGLPHVTFTTNKETAWKWYNTTAGTIFCRTILKGHGGDGIVLANRKKEGQQFTEETFPVCKLYTKYFKKNKEFRYHVMNNEVIDVQEKRRMNADKLQEKGFKPNPMIRNFANGWAFCREDVVVDDTIAHTCKEALHALGLDFGALDVLVNTDDNGKVINFAICEVNSAPGIEATSLVNYTKGLYKLIIKKTFEENGLI